MWLVLTLALFGKLDARLTPGVVRPGLTAKAICGTAWGRDARHVTVAMRRHVFEAYGVPWENRTLYEVDHRIPRELGGADDVRNLWPEPWPDAHAKDHEENRLHRAVCGRLMTLTDARTTILQWGVR